jgi:hypothetical protein
MAPSNGRTRSSASACPCNDQEYDALVAAVIASEIATKRAELKRSYEAYLKDGSCVVPPSEEAFFDNLLRVPPAKSCSTAETNGSTRRAWVTRTSSSTSA